jgi:type II secretory pathway predicted ATPase ExeA
LALDKQSVTLNTLIVALLYDLAGDGQARIAARKEKRERDLCALA